MLTRFRRTLTKFLEPLIWLFVKINVNPNLLTLSSLVIALMYLVLVTTQSTKAVPLYLSLYIFSALLDSIDGAVARKLGRTSLWGAFLDSLIDRICDGIFIFSLYFFDVAPLYLIVAEIIGAFLVSYSRARGESLGVKLEGIGITERSERLILIFLVILLNQVNKVLSTSMFYLLLLLTYITVLQRVIYIRSKLHRPSTHIPDCF